MNDKTPARTAPAEDKPLKRYRVYLNTWDTYRIVIEASSPEEAEEKAEELWLENCDNFTHKDGGNDGFDVQEM